MAYPTILVRTDGRSVYTGDLGSSLIDWFSGKAAKEERAAKATAKAASEQAAANLALAQAIAQQNAQAGQPSGGGLAGGATLIPGVPNWALAAAGVVLVLVMARRR